MKSKIIVLVMVLSCASFADDCARQLGLCDIALRKCDAVVRIQDEAISALETQNEFLKKKPVNEDWLVWLVGGVAVGLTTGLLISR